MNEEAEGLLIETLGTTGSASLSNNGSSVNRENLQVHPREFLTNVVQTICSPTNRDVVSENSIVDRNVVSENSIVDRNVVSENSIVEHSSKNHMITDNEQMISDKEDFLDTEEAVPQVETDEKHPQEDPIPQNDLTDTCPTDSDFRPRIIKLVNFRGEFLMCRTCSYKTRHLRWLRNHELMCQGNPARPATSQPPNTPVLITHSNALHQQMMLNNNLMGRVYPHASSVHPNASSVHPHASSVHPHASSVYPHASSVHLISPQVQHQSSTAEMIAQGSMRITGANVPQSSNNGGQMNVINSTANLVVPKLAVPSQHSISNSGEMNQVTSVPISALFSVQNAMAAPPLQRTPSIIMIPPGNTQFRCTLCHFIAPSQDVLESHMTIDHEPLYSCNYCEFKTKIQNEIKTHLEFMCKKRPPKCFTCLMCHTILYSSKEIEEHFRTCHPLVPQTSPENLVRICFDNRVALSNSQALPPRDNIVTQTVQPYFDCKYCSVKARTAEELNTHIYLCHRHPLDKPATPITQQGKIDLRSNRSNCSFDSLEFNVLPVPSPRDVLLPCTAKGCDFKTKTVFNLKRHVSTRHPPKVEKVAEVNPTPEVACQYCDALLPLSHLHPHIQGTHPEMIEATSKLLDVSCTWCDFKTTTTVNLRRHVLKRHPENGTFLSKTIVKTISCEHCEYMTNRDNNLFRHMRKWHPEKKDGYFVKTDTSDLADKKCDYCDFRTHSAQGKTNHVRRKHLEKITTLGSPDTVSCEHCNFITSTSDNLSRHKKNMHKPECTNQIPLEQSPKKREKNEKKKNFSCILCNFKTAYKENVARHVKNVHKDVIPAATSPNGCRNYITSSIESSPSKELTSSRGNCGGAVEKLAKSAASTPMLSASSTPMLSEQISSQKLPFTSTPLPHPYNSYSTVITPQSNNCNSESEIVSFIPSSNCYNSYVHIPPNTLESNNVPVTRDKL